MFSRSSKWSPVQAPGTSCFIRPIQSYLSSASSATPSRFSSPTRTPTALSGTSPCPCSQRHLRPQTLQPQFVCTHQASGYTSQIEETTACQHFNMTSPQSGVNSSKQLRVGGPTLGTSFSTHQGHGYLLPINPPTPSPALSWTPNTRST